MALPTILINSATGSDTQASGAGPGTALFGTTDASTDGAGTTVTVTAGTDLSGVATDGSHVIYLADATAGARNFGKITGSAGSGGATPNVTVSDAFGLTLSGKSWAIGGKRASIGSTTSKKLIDNNSAAGDAMPGWTMEMQSGHAETITATMTVRRAGSTVGLINLVGTAGAATLPILTFSNNGVAFSTAISYWKFKDFEVQNSNVTKSASVAFSSSNLNLFDGLKIANSTNNFWKAFDLTIGCRVLNSEIGYTASVGIQTTVVNNITVMYNIIHHCGANGMNNTSGTGMNMVAWNIFAYNTGDGLNQVIQAGGAGTVRGQMFQFNTFHGNTGDGLEIAGTADPWNLTDIRNNIFTFNGGYGLNLSGAGMSNAVFSGLLGLIDGNLHFTNTSGFISASITVDTNTTNADPSGGVTSATKDYAGTTNGLNFMVTAAAKAKGVPLGGTKAVGAYSTTYSYLEPGAAQRQEQSPKATYQVGF